MENGKVVEVVKKVNVLKVELTKTFVQRENEVTAVLSGLLSGEPVILVGDPGTAKTALIERLAKMIDAKYFYYLLTRFTEPDELLGALDINALREGKYVRRTEGKLPEAEVAFLDEIFKASSAIRNILLDIILNKRIFSDGTYIQLPMLALYTASNEISTDVEDMAFYDRMTIRDFVTYVGDESVIDLIKSAIMLEMTENNGGIKTIMSVEDVRLLQKLVSQRFYSLANNNTLLTKFSQAVIELKNKGIVLSDRRKVKVLKVASAISVVYAEDTVSLDSLAEALKFTAIHEPDDLEKVEQVIIKLGLSTFYKHVQELNTIKTELRNAIEACKNGGVNEIKMLTNVYKQVVAKVSQLPKNPRFIPYVKELKNLVDEAKRVLDMRRKELFGDIE